MGRTKVPIKERLYKHIYIPEGSVEGEDVCWYWNGDKNHKGYGRIRPEGGKEGEKVWAHRVSYEVHKGPIPKDMQIDHRCRNTSCVNPQHLEAVTLVENLERARVGRVLDSLPDESKNGERRVEKLLDLGGNLCIYKVHVDELKEQDVNARTMPKQMFDRLSKTIGRDARLESLPFIAQTEQGLEIVSGHHRVRASRAADVQEIHAIVDVSGLTPSQIKAKQLAHNSIAGEDNEQLLAKIYEDISEVDDRLEAFIDPESLDLKVDIVNVDNVDIGLEFITSLVVFMPYEKTLFERACDQLQQQGVGADVEQVYVADKEVVELWKNLVKRVGDEYDVRSLGTTMSLMGEIVLEHMGIDLDDDPMEGGRVHLRDIVGQTYIPEEAAEVIERAVEKMAEKNDISKKNRWQCLEYLAADYLGEG